MIYDTASIASLHALAAARHAAVPDVGTNGLAGRSDLGPLTVYTSEHGHSSIDKAVMTLGLGHKALRKIPVDSDFRMRPDTLAAAVAQDRANGGIPVAVVATVGTTSMTSIDPVPELANLCSNEGIWLHVDAAYAAQVALHTVRSERVLLPADGDSACSLLTHPGLSANARSRPS